MKQKNSNAAVNKLRIAAVTALIVMLLALSLKAAVSSDRRLIQQNMSMPEHTSSAEIPELEQIDKDELFAEAIGYELYPEQADSVRLSLGGFEASRSELQPVYNALFSDDGLQIASLADNRLCCAAAAVYPLSDMLSGFYEETGLRTIMVLSAYTPTEQPEPQGYFDELGSYYETSLDAAVPDEAASGLCIRLCLYDEEHGRTDFTGEGDYAWFEENAYRYGFVLRYPEDKQAVTGTAYDPSLYRYVGKPIAAVMQENSVCLEELKGFMINRDYDNAELLMIGETPTLIYSVPYPWVGSASIRLPASVEVADSGLPFSAYVCGELIIICAEPQDIRYTQLCLSDSAAKDNSDTNDTADITQ